MIKVERLSPNVNKVQIEGCPDILKIELRVLLNAIVDSPILEGIYLDIATEIAQAKVKDLERTLENLKHD